MTLAEQLRNEGFQKGLLEAVELGLNLKFGDAGTKLMPKVREIQDADKLKMIKESLKSMNNISDIEMLI